MSWQYRLIKYKDPMTDTGSSLLVHEVYFEEDGSIISWTKDKIKLYGENKKDILQVLETIKNDICNSPIMEEKSVDGKITLVETEE